MGGKGIFFVIILVLAFCVQGNSDNKKESKTTKLNVDHSKFPALKRNFIKPEDVTSACLTCHNKAGEEILKSSHWKWSRMTDKLAGKKGKMVKVGKINVINNFCIALESNWKRCTSCHIGYGWKDKNFDFTDQTKIDCLVCHEQTGTYKKFPAGAGYPVKERKQFIGNKKWYDKPDYTTVAQSVAIPSKKNCATCHFFGGGGHAVKHGDLDKSLFNPKRETDVHMTKEKNSKGLEGPNMKCSDCHISVKHDLKGQLYSVSVEDKDRVSCQRCHTVKPHTRKLFVEDYAGMPGYHKNLKSRKEPSENFIHNVLNKHTEKIACQTCHIPYFAKKHKTKIWWDWSKAGEKNAKGKPKVIKDKDGLVTYHGKKGEFKWSRNLVPGYYWFNGEMSHMMYGDKIDPQKIPVELNTPLGECGKGRSKIWPMKVMKGKQLYDPENKTIIIPKLFGKKGSGAYWAEFDWGKASAAGMKSAGVPYSGKYDWIETNMYWPLTHLVTTKEKSLTCNDCHSRNGRLAGVEACWIPGRDRSLVLDIIGWIMVLGSFAGVSVHGFLRYSASKKKMED